MRSEGAELIIGARFNGPETTANGGYACGRLAAFLTEPAEVTLRLPPPLEMGMTVLVGGDGTTAELHDGEALVANGKSISGIEAEPPLRPSFAAAPWIPDPSVTSEENAELVDPAIVWATLDCTSYVPDMWMTPTVSVLGRMAVQRERQIAIGERLVGLGWALGAEGRKRFTASALIEADSGEVVARARSIWIELRG